MALVVGGGAGLGVSCGVNLQQCCTCAQLGAICCTRAQLGVICCTRAQLGAICCTRGAVYCMIHDLLEHNSKGTSEA